jgi:zinc transporter
VEGQDPSGGTLNGLVHAGVLDGRGGVRELDWEGLRRWTPADGVLWAHFDYAFEPVRRWLAEESRIEPLACAALLAEDPRPRGLAVGDALLVIFRGINLNTGAEPEDMVSIRMLVARDRIVSLRHRRMTVASGQWASLRSGCGPVDAGDVLVRICDSIVRGVGARVSEVDDTVDDLEERMVAEQREEMRHRLAEVRREAIGLRRYIGPQRDALNRLQGEPVSWLTPEARARLREVHDRLLRIIEELDAARDRAAVTQEELASRTGELINRRLYVLSLVAAVFLPLGLVTGLLGVNVGGIPGTESPAAFWVLSGLLLVIAVGLVVVFRRLRWM